MIWNLSWYIYLLVLTRIEEYIKKSNKSHIFKHLHSTATCFGSYDSLCFKIIGKANSKFDLKINDEFVLINNMPKEYNEMKEEIKNLKT